MRRAEGPGPGPNSGPNPGPDHPQVVLNKMVERPGNDDIHKAFRLFDQGQKGKVDFDDLKQIATQASSE
eukprot:scaffold74646_cov66-Phaeocystis_antarctica.AAC.1